MLSSPNLVAPAAPGPPRASRGSSRSRDRKELEDSGQLTFSSFARPAIVLESGPCTSSSPQQSAKVKLSWWPVALSPRSLAGFVDGLIVLAGTLLFSLLSISHTHVFPTWPVALASAVGVIAVFAMVYRILFQACARTTPGQRLADLASGGAEVDNGREEEPPRFR